MNLGNEAETMSNGHRRITEPIELIDTMKRLRMEVWNYIYDNGRSIKSQE
jgi:hypothetical protein